MAEEDIADMDITLPDVEAAKGLHVQMFTDLDSETLSPLTKAVMSRQATINIGTIGHVAHGKSTVVKAISDVRTTKYRREAELNITIHLGYANAKVFKCPKCPEPECFHSFRSNKPDATPCPNKGCDATLELQRHFSFVDCPGHDILMSTMLNGAAIMDAALLLVAANETFPQPQTLEHLKAVEIMQLSYVLVLQNKIDLVKESAAQEQCQAIRAYLKNTAALNSPIIPIAAQAKHNIDLVLQYLTHIPIPTRKLRDKLRMIIVRSFDVNKPGEEIEKLQGGVAGGSVQQGVLRSHASLEIRPGLTSKNQIQGENGPEVELSCEPMRSKALSINSESIPLLYAIPGGLIGVGMNLDPSLTRQNKLVGHIIGEPGSLPDVFNEIEVEFSLLPQLIGVKSSNNKATKVTKLSVGETLQINVGSLGTAGVVSAVQTSPVSVVRIDLIKVVCASIQESVAISRRVDRHWRLIGWGRIVRGSAVKVVTYGK